MPRAAPQPSARRATNVTLPEDLVNEARALRINVSQACEAGLAAALAAARREAWRAENREAMVCWNEYVEQHGLPLAAYRQF